MTFPSSQQQQQHVSESRTQRSLASYLLVQSRYDLPYHQRNSLSSYGERDKSESIRTSSRYEVVPPNHVPNPAHLLQIRILPMSLPTIAIKVDFTSRRQMSSRLEVEDWMRAISCLDFSDGCALVSCSEACWLFQSILNTVFRAQRRLLIPAVERSICRHYVKNR